VKLLCLIVLFASGSLCGQTGQEGPRPEWPCVAGRAVDPAYLETSESTGGQVFLFQKSEIGQAGLFLSADFTHPATVVRAIGSLSGPGEFEFPVDSTMQSLLVMASIQCRKSIGVFRPSGTEMTTANSTQSVDLQASRAVKMDNPEPGKWKVRLDGSGVFVLSIRAQSPLRLSGIEFLDESGVTSQPRLGIGQTGVAHVSGKVGALAFEVLGPNGEMLSTCETPQVTSGSYQFLVTPAVERFRIRMTGVDASGWPVQRTDPVLFRARPRN
jgi:hypothetical protein